MAQGALKKSKAPTSGKGLKKAASVKRAVETAKKTRKGALPLFPLSLALSLFLSTSATSVPSLLCALLPRQHGRVAAHVAQVHGCCAAARCNATPTPAAAPTPPPRPPPAGAMQKNPKRAQLKEAHKESLELTKAINADNEEHFTAQAAAQPGGKLSVVRGSHRGQHCWEQWLMVVRCAPPTRPHHTPSAVPDPSRAQLKAPVAATADQKQRAKKSLKPGNVHGFARQ